MRAAQCAVPESRDSELIGIIACSGATARRDNEYAQAGLPCL